MSQPVDATEEAIAAWIGREREACEPPPPPKPKGQTVLVEDLDPTSSLAHTAKMVAELSQAALSASFAAGMVKPDARTREQYDAQVEDYLGRAAAALPGAILKRAHDKRLGLLVLSVRNETEQPIQSLLLEVAIGVEGLWAASGWDPDLEKAKMPSRPIMLGKDRRSPFDNLGALHAPILSRPWLDLPSVTTLGPGLSIDNSGSTRLTFDDIDLYPEETVPLAEVFLYANASLHAGQTLRAEWSARARNLAGVMRGDLEILVDFAIPTIDELLAEDEKPSQNED